MRGLALAAILQGAAWAQATPPPPLPSLSELEAAGVRIGKIHVVPRNIFDPADPEEDKRLFRWANALHIQTRPGVIERALLFRTGDLLTVRLFEETERLLRSNRYLYDVQIRPLALQDGVVDIEVSTRDTWSLDPGISAGRAGGASSSGLKLSEYNLLGTGASISFGHSSNVDRSGNEFQFFNNRAFGTLAAVSFDHASNSDGRRDAASVIRPFVALDSRWAAGLSASKDDRIEAIYNAGEVVGGYRHRQEAAEVSGGWSPGLRNGWVQRYSLGVSYQDDAYALEPGQVAPARLPSDDKLVAPFVRFELIEDRYERELNRNLIGRPEFFALGLASSIRLGRASTGLGSSRDAWLYSGSVSRGFEPKPGQTLITAAAISGQFSAGGVRRQLMRAQAQYYLPQNNRWLFFASVSGDQWTRPDVADALLLGGDNGLRGYPLRYQSGTRRALLTVEERFFTDLYVWQLFHVGGATFFDAGRAWGGDNVNSSNPGWISNAGFGLRVVSARSAFSNVLHVDLAFPLNATGGMKKFQFLVKTKASF